MKNNIHSYINKKIEIFAMGIISLIIIGLIISNFSYVENIYLANNLNNIIIEVFGVLFGLLLTAYTILFGLIPSLKKDMLETRAFESINFRFFLAIIINLFILSVSLLIYFVEGFLKEILIAIQLSTIVVLLQFFVILLLYLFYLLRIARNTRL